MINYFLLVLGKICNINNIPSQIEKKEQQLKQ